MYLRHIPSVLGLLAALVVAVPAPAQAASGPWSVVSSDSFHTCHTCAINNDRSLYCWGDNGFGQIGDSTTTDRPTSKRIGAARAWASVAAGGRHTCAINTGRSLYCW